MPAVLYHLGQFQPPALDWPQLIPLLGPSSAVVVRYDGTLAAVPNAAVLLWPLTTQEAVLSSRIEGTQATMGEVLGYAPEGGVGGCARGSGHLHRKPVCGSLFAETEPQSALLPTRAPHVWLRAKLSRGRFDVVNVPPTPCTNF